MEESTRRKLFALAEKVEGKDISIMKEVRIDNLMDELGGVSPESVQQVISQVLSCSVEEVQEKLADEESQQQLTELLRILGGTA